MVRPLFVLMFIHELSLALANQSVRILEGEIRIPGGCETEIGDNTTCLRYNRLGRLCLPEKNIIV